MPPVNIGMKTGKKLTHNFYKDLFESENINFCQTQPIKAYSPHQFLVKLPSLVGFFWSCYLVQFGHLDKPPADSPQGNFGTNVRSTIRGI